MRLLRLAGSFPLLAAGLLACGEPPVAPQEPDDVPTVELPFDDDPGVVVGDTPFEVVAPPAQDEPFEPAPEPPEETPPPAEESVSPPEAVMPDWPASRRLVEERPYRWKVPRDYRDDQPTPLLILLHGFTADGWMQDVYFRLSALADERNFLYAYPDGTRNLAGLRFWNATDACCDYEGRGIDDVAYISAIIDDLEYQYNVDPKRIFLVGHSNGGFMAHRMACDVSHRIAGIVSLAGGVWKDITRCNPTEPVAVLQVHGTLDVVIPYLGGSPGIVPLLPAAPGAKETVRHWAAFNGCHPGLTDERMRMDLDWSLLGRETKVERHLLCEGGAAELWSIRGGSHIPAFRSRWADAVYDFLMAHPKP